MDVEIISQEYFLGDPIPAPSVYVLNFHILPNGNRENVTRKHFVNIKRCSFDAKCSQLTVNYDAALLSVQRLCSTG